MNIQFWPKRQLQLWPKRPAIRCACIFCLRYTDKWAYFRLNVPVLTCRIYRLNSNLIRNVKLCWSQPKPTLHVTYEIPSVRTAFRVFVLLSLRRHMHIKFFCIHFMWANSLNTKNDVIYLCFNACDASTVVHEFPRVRRIVYDNSTDTLSEFDNIVKVAKWNLTRIKRTNWVTCWTRKLLTIDKTMLSYYPYMLPSKTIDKNPTPVIYIPQHGLCHIRFCATI